MQGKRHDRVVEMRLCFFSGKVDDYKVLFESIRKCRSTLRPDEKILTYEYDTENRLRAVKENGRLLQAALYDGDDNRVFVANRKVVTEQKDKTTGSNRGAGAEAARELSEEEDGGGDEDGDPAGARKDPADPGEDGKETGRGGASRDSCFWYGFLQNLSQGFALTDSAVSDALHRFWDGLKEWWHVHVLGDRADPDGILRHPVRELPDPEGFPESGEPGGDGGEGNPSDALCRQTLIPCGVSETERDTYELTCYINDINRAYTETLMEYTPGLQALGSTYEYGVERLSYYDEEEGDCYAYAYDGRGSVANLTGETGESVVSYTYDIYGSVEERSGAQADLPNPYLYRGEYTDALTGNQYLRARYYRPSTGSFLTRDTYPGDQTEPVSLNRYTYAGNDPVNLEDPSGHGWLKKKVQQAKQAVKKTVSKAKKAVKSAAKKVEKAVKKTAAKVVKKAKTVVKKAVKKAKTVVKKAKKTVKKVVRKAAKKVKSSKLYKKAKKTATKIKKKVCTTAKRIQKATVSFVKNVDWKKVVAGTVAAVAIAGAVALTGGAAMPVLIGAAQAGGMGALVSGAVAAAQGGSIADIA